MREGSRCLTEHHDHKRSCNGWKHERCHGIYHFQSREHTEHRNHDGCKRNHHSSQQDGKYNVFSFVVIDLKAITGDGTNQQTQDSQYCCISEGIPQCQSQILVRNQCFVVFNQIRSRNQFTCDNVNALVCRCTEHIVQWKYRNN